MNDNVPPFPLPPRAKRDLGIPSDLWDSIVEGGPEARGMAPGGPNPVPAVRKRRKGKTPHKLLLEACRHALHLQWPHALVETRNVAVVDIQDTKRGGFRKVRFGQTGEADLRFMFKGVCVALECKAHSTRDKQSDAQKRWATHFERAGGVYGVVYSQIEAVELVKRAIKGTL